MLNTFGGLRVEDRDFYRTKPLLLLAFLAIEGPQPRRHLAELFWPASDKGLRSLATTLTRLRNGIPNAICADGDRVWATLRSDVELFTKRLGEGDVVRARELYHGAFLDGVHVVDCGVELEEWIYATRELLAAKLQEALMSVAEAVAASGDFETGARHAEAAHGVPGAPAPDPEFLERCYTVLQARGSPGVVDVKRDAKGFGVAFSLTPQEARARLLRDAERETAVPSRPASPSIPRRTTSFIGREAELTALGRLLSDPETRLITLVGIGGIGKSRLAIQASLASRAETLFEGGIFFVSLETLTEPAHIAQAVASALELEPVQHGDTLAQIIRVLRAGRILLVLDNCEQLVGGAAIVSDLIRSCPLLTVLVTSRERLNLEGEQLFRLGGLSWLSENFDRHDAHQQEAVTLFVQRAKRVSLDFELTADTLGDVCAVCELVDGSPLGIELAAAWVGVMSPREIVAELGHSMDMLRVSTRDVAERHTSIRASFESSWRLLAAEEQTTLSKLAVFVGGFTRRAAATVVSATTAELAALVDKSLLRVLPNGRFDRHPLLYDYFRQMLAERPRELAEAEARHAAFFLELAEEAETQLQGSTQGRWLEVLEREHANLRAALRWTTTHGRIETGVRLAAALWRFWHMRGHLCEGREWLECVLSRPGADMPTHARAKALSGAGVLTWMQGELAQARALFAEGLEIMDDLGDELGRAKALNNLGILAYLQEDHSEAQRVLASSLASFERLRDPAGAAGARGNLGIVLFVQGDLPEARRTCEEVLAFFRSRDDAWGVVTSLNNLARVVERQGEEAYAAAVLAEGLALGEEIGATRVQVDMVQQAAALLVRSDAAVAARLMLAAEAFRELIGAPMEPVSRPCHTRVWQALRARLGEPELALERTAATTMGLSAAVKLTLSELKNGDLQTSSEARSSSSR